MRLARILGLLIAGFIAALMIGAGAPAQAASLTLDKGGSTAITTAPGVGVELIRNGLAAYTSGGASTTIKCINNDLQATYKFPVSGGTLDTSAFTGTVQHKGSLSFVNVSEFRQLTITDLHYEVAPQVISGRIAGTQNRVALFDVDSGELDILVGQGNYTLTGLKLKVSAAGATALNDGLETDFFTAGYLFATSVTTVNS